MFWKSLAVSTTDKKKNKYLLWFFIFLVLLISFSKILTSPIVGWRVSDSLSIAQNYYYNHLSFLNPAMNDYRANNSSITLTEFPIIYYFAALIWQATGENIWVPRLLTLLCSLGGLMALYQTSLLFFKEQSKAFIIVLVLLISPTFLIYSFTPIPNIPALSFTFIGVYFSYNSYLKNNFWFLLIGLISFTLACLLKITNLISFSFVLLCYCYFNLKSKKNNVLIIIGAICSLLTIYSWVLFLKQYNNESASSVLLNQFSSINLSQKQIIEYLISDAFLLKFRLLYPIYFWVLLVTSMVLIIYQAIIQKKYFLTAAFLFLIMGTIAYFLVFFLSFNAHRYYIIDFIPLILFTIGSGLFLLKEHFYQKIKSILITGLILNALYSSIYLCEEFNRLPLTFKKLLPKTIQKDFQENHDYFQTKIQPLHKYRDTIKNLGINRLDSKVIFLTDGSPNIGFYQLNLKGVTNCNFCVNTDISEKLFEDKIIYLRSIGYQYVIIEKKKPFNKDIYKFRNKVLFEDDYLQILELNSMLE